MEFRLLGPLEVVDDAGRPLRLGGARPRALLAVLLLRANEVVSVDALIDALWGESPPEAAANTVQVYIGRLRKVLDPERSDERLATRPPGYVIHVGEGELDTKDFEQLARGGRQALAAGKPGEARDRLEAALGRWRGSALADLSYESFVREEAERLEELRLAALEDRMTADLDLGVHAELVPELEGLVAHHPLRERLSAQLMVALYRSGRQADALATYRRLRERLVEELGIDPSPELRDLEQRILLQDDALRSPDTRQEAPADATLAPAPAPVAPAESSDVPDSAGIRKALRVGEYLSALDEADALLARRPGDVRVRYWRALALARAGGADELEPEIDALSQLAERTHVADDLAEDIAALRARVLKARALASVGRSRATRAAEAAALYESIYKRLRRPYSCINAATMWRVAGDGGRAETLAAAALALTRARTAGSREDRYWLLATEAEAQLLLGHVTAARAALERARADAGDDIAALATTRTQLEVVCDETSTARDVLSPLALPTVIHYTGHRVTGPQGRFRPDQEAPVAASIAACLQDHDVGFGYGSLASGADILFAEALLARGAELHVVLPFAVETFMETSVSAAGTSWVSRFTQCLDEATSVTIASAGGSRAHDLLLAHGASLAMGRAVMRASLLNTDIAQYAFWDGEIGAQGVGTMADIVRWMSSGRPTHLVPGGALVPVVPSAMADASAHEPDRVAAVLVAELVGFERLDDVDLMRVSEMVLGPLSAALKPLGTAVVDRARWGSRMCVVITDVAAAATVALGLQDVIAGIDFSTDALPRLTLRILVHAAPVLLLTDPLLERPAIFGTEALRLMTLEPRVPAGEVYATDAFASLLMLDAAHDFACRYVGRVEASTAEVAMPLYVVRRAIDRLDIA